MSDYPPLAKIYWWAVVIAGYAVIGASLHALASLPWTTLAQILGTAAIMTVLGLFPVRMPGQKISIAGAEIFGFLLLLLFGPAAATLAASCEAIAAVCRTSKRWTSWLGSPAITGLVMWLAGWCFVYAQAALQSWGLSQSAAMYAALMAAALLNCCLGTLAVTTLLALKTGKRMEFGVLVHTYGWMLVSFAASAAIAGLVYMAYEIMGPTAVLVAVPIIGMFLSTMHLFFRQAEADRRIAEEAAKHLAALQASERRFQSAFTHAAVGMILLAHDRKILQTNQALRLQLGRAEIDLVGLDMAAIVHPDDNQMLLEEIGTLLNGGAEQLTTELRCLHGNGESVWVALNGALFPAESGERCLIMQLQDVTARKHAEARLHHIAFHDGLTGLPNRSYFNGELSRVVAESARDPRVTYAVMFLDFDRFKTINDTLGHGAGDELLAIGAKRLRNCVRPSDLVARLGGDEFAILLHSVRSDQNVIELAERIQASVQEPLAIGGKDVRTSASIGITTSAWCYRVPEDVLRDADIAMYAAKEQGRARYAVFDRDGQRAPALHAEGGWERR